MLCSKASATGEGNICTSTAVRALRGIVWQERHAHVCMHLVWQYAALIGASMPMHALRMHSIKLPVCVDGVWLAEIGVDERHDDGQVRFILSGM